MQDQTTQQPTLDPQVVNLAKAIRQTESGGNYSAQGKSGEGGAYQFTPTTWSAAASRYGINVPLAQATPEQQNAVAYNRIKGWKDSGKDVTQIASMWNAGEGEPNAYTGKFGSTTPTHKAGDPSTGVNSFGAKYDVPAYAKSVADAYLTLKNGGQVQADPNNPSSTANPQNQPDNGGNPVGNFLGGLVSAPATLLARPFQLGAEALGASDQQVNDFTKQYGGGIIAPTPQDLSGVVSDVGRGAQTVALGLGEAPLAAGALFGGGSAVEQQGTKAFTTPEGATNTLASTLVGMGVGKALDLVGKPLFNVAGKVVGTITPKILQDVAVKGASAVTDFMAQHELFGGAFTPASEAISKGAQSFDTGVNNLFSGASNAVKGAVQGQYPGLSPENVAQHYQDIEIKRLMEPATAPGKTFNKAAAVNADAVRRGIDLGQIAADNKIYASDNITQGKFDTTAAADVLQNEAINGSADVLRPALKAAGPSVQRVPLSEIQQGILERIGAVPDSQLSPQQKLAFAKKVVAEYGAESAAGRKYSAGYSLEDLYNSKLQTVSGLYSSPKNGGVQSISDALTAKQKKIESDVFDSLLRKYAPPELGLDAYFKAQEGKFALANYLRTLDGNTAPQTLFQKGLKKAAQLGGATFGASKAGPFGMFSGYQLGGVIADTFAQASNPVKVSYLESIGKTPPEIYEILRQYVGDQEAQAAVRKLLPASFPGSIPDLMRMQNARGAVEMPGRAPGEVGPAQRMANNAIQNNQILQNTTGLPAPNPNVMITPNTGGTPNQPGAPYQAGGNTPEAGGLRQRIGAYYEEPKPKKTPKKK